MEEFVKTEPLLSIILPVYNVAPYVEECLKSIYVGKIPEKVFEVIVVNDGSTDNSMDIISSFCTYHDNIIIINQENQGLSAARLKGLSASKGKFIWFVDSDDWLESDAIQMVTGILTGTTCEVLATPLLWRYDDSAKNHQDYDISSPSRAEGKEILINGYIPAWAAPRYVIDRRLFDNPFLTFPEGLLHEDEYFGRVLLFLAKDVVVLDKPVYNYRQRNMSIMKSLSIRSSYDIVSIYDRLMQFADTLPKADSLLFAFHCQRLLVRSYTINRDKWGSSVFSVFKKKNQFHIMSEFIRLSKFYSIKELLLLIFLTVAPVSYGKVFPIN